MAFLLRIEYIRETEHLLNVEFPISYVNKMLTENGGEISTEEDFWEVYPIADKTDVNTISRTCNDIIYETKEAHKWRNFPQHAIAIAANGFGDQMILIPEDNNPKKLREEIFMWFHENGEIVQIANDITELIEKE